MLPVLYYTGPPFTQRNTQMTDNVRKRIHTNVGAIVREAREREGYSQNALAKALGYDYYTMISNIELGKSPIPPSQWNPLINVLRMDRGKHLALFLWETQPDVYVALFGKRGLNDVGRLLDLLHKGALDIKEGG